MHTMKKLFGSFVSIFIFLAVSTQAQDSALEKSSQGLTNVGYAPFNLTANNFNCDGFIESLQPLKEWHISILYHTFGNNFQCLERLMSNSRLKTLQIHLINEPGHRNRRLGPYEFLYSISSPSEYDRLLKRHDQKLKQRFVKYVVPLQNMLENNLQPHTELLISPGLESNISAAGAKTLVSWTRPLFPNARIVWNPHRASLSTRKFVKADLIEAHGQFPPLKAPCIYNMDGTDVKYRNRPALGEDSGVKNYFHSGTPLFQQMEKYANRCEIAFVWTQEGNGLRYDQGFRDPRKRNHNISTKMYKQIMTDIIRVHRRGQIAPISDTYTALDNYPVSMCNVISSNFEDSPKSGNLLKQSEFPDRGGVLLLPKNFSNVSSAKLYKGKTVVDTYNKTATYHDGRPLLRSEISPTKYPFNTYLVFNSNSTKYCYKLPNPRIRLD